MRIAHLGKKHSVETKGKISKSHLSKLNPNYGKHPSSETRAKLSASRTGKKNHQWGKPHPPEVREKIRKSLLGRFCGINNPHYGKHLSEETIHKIFKANQAKPNKQEIKLQAILNNYFPSEWKFVGDGQLIIGGLCPDFTNINGRKCLIELFGDYWHSAKVIKNWTRTEIGRIMYYNSYGYKCLIIWEHELRNEEAVVEKIKQWQNLKSSFQNTVCPVSS